MLHHQSGSSTLVHDGGTRAQRSLRSHQRREAAKTGLRQVIQRSLDSAQFRFDTFPRLLYQPVPWAGKHAAGRARGSHDRLAAITAELRGHSVGTALDIGCQAGFFTISLAEQGVTTLGVDIDERSLRIARYAARRAGVHNAGFCDLLIDPTSVALLPKADAVLLLSVWHHWVYCYGREASADLVRQVWNRCGHVLFFETGEDEMPPEFGLPAMPGGTAAWLADYLGENCAGGTVEALGRFQAFGVGGDETSNVAHRTLFAVRRTTWEPDGA